MVAEYCFLRLAGAGADDERPLLAPLDPGAREPEPPDPEGRPPVPFFGEPFEGFVPEPLYPLLLPPRDCFDGDEPFRLPDEERPDPPLPCLGRPEPPVERRDCPLPDDEPPLSCAMVVILPGALPHDVPSGKGILQCVNGSPPSTPQRPCTMPRLPIDGIDERREVMAVSRFSTRAELLEDADGARRKLEDLISRIPDEALVIEVTDGMSTKDFLAHRTEWGRMMIRWYTEAADGGSPAVPSDRHTWRELPALNAEIHERFADISPTDARAQFAEVHDALRRLIASCTDDELFTKHHYDFTGSSDLATYFVSATGGHYRSAYKHIDRWWRANRDAYDTSDS